jgi:hypothetical protein
MNRTVALAGSICLVAGALVIGTYFAYLGGGGYDLVLFLGALGVTVGLILVPYSVTLPDAQVTTVRGMFGSEEENLLDRRMRGQGHRPVDSRYLPSPRDSVNCSRCYTVIPAQTVMCPRCGTHRRCQQCAKPLFFLAGMVRCGPCAKDEIFCDCPRATLPSRAVRGHAHAGR